MIKRIERDDIKICAQIIRQSFVTVAQGFNLIKENCPGNTSFLFKKKNYISNMMKADCVDYKKV